MSLMNLNSVVLKTTKNDDELIGSTAVVLNPPSNNKLLIIGGVNNNTIKNPYLNIKLFSLLDYEYKASTINTNGIVNTMFHATTLLFPERKNQGIFLFGGRIHNRYIKDVITYSNKIIKLQDTEFGFNVSTIIDDVLIGREGLSVNAVGKDYDKALVFGGRTTNNQYLNDILLLNETEEKESEVEGSNEEKRDTKTKMKWELKALPTEGEVPAHRAYHSNVVAGECNQSVIIFGGKDDKTIFQDLWVLDITAILNPVDPSTIPVDPKAKGKGAPPTITAPSGIWSKLLDSSAIVPRYMHFSLISNSNINSNNTGTLGLCIFGGINVSDENSIGLSLKDIWSTTISFLGDRKYQANDFISVESTDNSTFKNTNTLYGSASVPIVDKITNTDDPSISISKCSACFIFGGSSLLVNQEINDDNSTKTLYLAVDIKSKLVQAAKKINNALLGVDDSLLNVTKTQINFPNGDIYIGFAMDVINENGESETLPHGLGKMTCADGQYFEGDYQNGKKNGNFKHTMPDGKCYVGGYINDVRCGEGKLSQIIDGREHDIYTGEWSNDMYNGKGLLIEEHGNYHRGLFANNLKHGKGLYYDASTCKSIEGEWNKNVLYKGFTAALKINSFNGKSGGRFDTSDTASTNTVSGTYTGMVTNGIPDTPIGQDATCLYDDGSKYVGGFRAGRRSGFGTFTTSKGDQYIGKYVADKLNGLASWNSETKGERFEGLWADHKPNGKGKYFYIDGSTYDGDWRDGKRHGFGTLTWSSTPSPRKQSLPKYEISYQGDWIEDSREGLGTIYYSDGTYQKATFKNNTPQ